MVEPYRDVFYESCVYNPLLTAVKHFCGTVAPYLANDTFYYATDPKGHFWMEKKQRVDELQLLQDMGLILEVHEEVPDIRKLAIDTLRDSGLLYLSTDLYEIPGYGNYQESHQPHWWLVWNWTESEEVFQAFEAVDDPDDTNCANLPLSADLIAASYKSAVAHLKRWDWRSCPVAIKDGTASSMSAAHGSYVEQSRVPLTLEAAASQ